jgi:hypothetical protein
MVAVGLTKIGHGGREIFILPGLDNFCYLGRKSKSAIAIRPPTSWRSRGSDQTVLIPDIVFRSEILNNVSIRGNLTRIASNQPKVRGTMHSVNVKNDIGS